MTGAQGRASREKRWLVIAEDGRHVTLGRHIDPSEEEVTRAGQQLDSLGLASWLAVAEGRYYSRDRVSLLLVRRITIKDADWPAAERLWHALRKQAIESA